MARFRGQQNAFDAPGYEPRWTNADRDGVGTAFSSGSRVWFTIWKGILTEVCYPTVDRPQLRDLQLLFADGNGVCLEEKSDLNYSVERLSPSQGYTVESHATDSRVDLTKEIIADPDWPSVLIHTKLVSPLNGLKTYLLAAAHLEGGGNSNHAFVVEASGRELLVAEKKNRRLALGASCGFARLSCGYVRTSDGYTDLIQHHAMSHEFDKARDGNVALNPELDPSRTPESRWPSAKPCQPSPRFSRHWAFPTRNGVRYSSANALITEWTYLGERCKNQILEE